MRPYRPLFRRLPRRGGVIFDNGQAGKFYSPRNAVKTVQILGPSSGGLPIRCVQISPAPVGRDHVTGRAANKSGGPSSVGGRLVEQRVVVEGCGQILPGDLGDDRLEEWSVK